MNNKNTTKNGQVYGQILGINVISSQISEVLARVEENIPDSSKLGGSNNKFYASKTKTRKFYILTPNPEIILMALKNQKLKDALNGTNLVIPDGIGLAMAYKFLKLTAPKNKIFRIVISFFQGIVVGLSVFVNKGWLTSDLKILEGRRVFIDLIALAERNSWKVFLLGGLGKEAEAALQKIKASNPKLQIQSFRGPRLNSHAKPVTESDRKLQEEAVEKINKFAPQLLFVAFGNPKQEIWVHENYSKLKIGGAMAVGGAFRYIAGQSSLPPKWMADIGLEWLWRLITEPHRINRIFNAVFVFPFKVFLSKL